MLKNVKKIIASFFRELVLSCLAAYTEPLESTVKCLDAFGATGEWDASLICLQK